MAFLGDIISVGSVNHLDEIIKAKADELVRRFGLTKEEESIIATQMFVAVLQTDVIPERRDLPHD